MERYEHGGDIFTNTGINLDFSVNLNPLGMPKAVVNVIRDKAESFAGYPDPKCRELVSAIAEHEGCPSEWILCGNGADDLIFRLCQCLMPKKVLLCSPTFSEYERAVHLSGGSTKYHKLSYEDTFLVSNRILDDIGSDTNIVFLCNPNNPTGLLIDFNLLLKIAEKCRKAGITLIIDECFLPFTDGSSAKELLPDFDNIVILKAFTKLYSMAGLRLGYMLTSNKNILKKTHDAAQYWSVSTVAQAAGIAALSCVEYVQETKKILRSEREFLISRLSQMGLQVIPSDANFLLIRSDVPLYEPLLSRGILVRDCSNFEGLNSDFIRICIKTREANKILLNNIKEVLYG